MGVACLHVEIMQTKTKSKSMAAQIPLTAVAVGSKLLFSELQPPSTQLQSDRRPDHPPSNSAEPWRLLCFDFRSLREKVRHLRIQLRHTGHIVLMCCGVTPLPTLLLIYNPESRIGD